MSGDASFVEKLEYVGTGSEWSINAKGEIKGVRCTISSPSLFKKQRGSECSNLTEVACVERWRLKCPESSAAEVRSAVEPKLEDCMEHVGFRFEFGESV